MSTSVIAHRVALSALPVLEAKAWREALAQQLRDGARVVTLYGRHGRRRDDQVITTAVLETADSLLHILRGTMSIERGYHELTSEFAALHCFERELHEQTGVRIAGHPWLKPIRYEGQEQSAMDSYPFYKIEGKEVHEVAVGPIHAGVIEPGSFRFMCHGEQVHHLEIQLGYQHRGVEQRLLQGDARQLAPLCETIAGDTSVAHAWAYCAAIEQLAECELDLTVDVARAVVLELERIAMHLAGLSGLCADVGFLQGASSYGRLRTTAINTTMRLCGSRFGRGALRPGGIGMQPSQAHFAEVVSNMNLLRDDLAIINECVLASQTVQHRLSAVGVLTTARAQELGIVGMAARASGVALDARQASRDGAYKQHPIAPAGFSEGDCWARARIRIAELDASLTWLTEILAHYPIWDCPRRSIGALLPEQLVVTLVEGWRGEVVHCLETDAAGSLAHYKVQDPSLRNWMGLAIAVRGNEISDFPICNKSFDLSYCGNDL